MYTKGAILIEFERDGDEGTILEGRQGAMRALLRLERALNGLGIGEDGQLMGIEPGWRFHFQEPKFVGEDGALEPAPALVTEEQFAATHMDGPKNERTQVIINGRVVGKIQAFKVTEKRDVECLLLPRLTHERRIMQFVPGCTVSVVEDDVIPCDRHLTTPEDD
jgi:hypothetical protein